MYMLMEKGAFLFYTKTLEEAEAEKERLLTEDPTKDIRIASRLERGEPNE